MSATTAQPNTGYASPSAPIWAFVILVGALALGAVGIAIGQGYQAAPAGAIPADLRGVHAAQQVVDQNQATPAGAIPADLRGVHAAQQVDQNQATPAGAIAADLRRVHSAQQVDQNQAAPTGAVSLPSPVSPARNGHYRDHAR